MASFTAGTTFVDGVSNDVTAAKLGALVTNATPTSGFIQDRTAETVTATNDTLLIGDASDSNNLKRITVANFAQTLPTAKVTTGTIETGTFGTTTSTAATITTGTIPTLVATTLITTGTGTAAAPAIVPTGDTNTGFFFPAADTIAFSEGGAEAMRIDSSGKVLIGTTSNDTGGRLEVKQASSETGIGIQSSGTDDSKLYFRTASGTYGGDIVFNGSYVKVSSGTTERMRIDSSGNVGIGETNPQKPLHVKSSSAAELLRLQSPSNTGQAFITYYKSGGTRKAYIGYASSVNEEFFISNDENGPMSFYTFGTERLRVDASGNVLVGTTTAIGKFTVEAAGGGASTTPITTNSITGAGTRFAAGFYYSGTKVGGIEVTASATSYVTSSDYRLKTNLESISNGIERVKQLPVYRFNWIADQSGNKVDGFVAHEAKQIIPECVSGEKDAVDADGNPIYQGIDQSKIVPLLTAALKEAITKIEVLESKVAALEAA